MHIWLAIFCSVILVILCIKALAAGIKLVAYTCAAAVLAYTIFVGLTL